MASQQSEASFIIQGLQTLNKKYKNEKTTTINFHVGLVLANNTLRRTCNIVRFNSINLFV